MSWPVGALIGFLTGVTFGGSLAYIALHPPEGYRRFMGYKDLSEYEPHRRRTVIIAAIIWVLVVSAALAALAAWALPPISRSGQ